MQALPTGSYYVLNNLFLQIDISNLPVLTADNFL